MYYFGGSFAKCLRGEIAKYNDIDLYVGYEDFFHLLEKLATKGQGIIEHLDDKIVSHSTRVSGIDIMVFRKDFKFSTEVYRGFNVLSRRTMKKIYRYAKKKNR